MSFWKLYFYISYNIILFLTNLNNLAILKLKNIKSLQSDNLGDL